LTGFLSDRKKKTPRWGRGEKSTREILPIASTHTNTHIYEYFTTTGMQVNVLYNFQKKASLGKKNLDQVICLK
jgi:hypothetical protein